MGTRRKERDFVIRGKFGDEIARSKDITQIRLYAQRNKPTAINVHLYSQALKPEAKVNVQFENGAWATFDQKSFGEFCALVLRWKAMQNVPFSVNGLLWGKVGQSQMIVMGVGYERPVNRKFPVGIKD